MQDTVNKAAPTTGSGKVVAYRRWFGPSKEIPNCTVFSLHSNGNTVMDALYFRYTGSSL